MADPCEMCVFFTYNEDIENYECLINLDEDDVYHFFSGSNDICPYFRLDDEYGVVQHQN